MGWQTLPAGSIPRVVEDAATSPRSDPTVHYPGWYLKRWHCLPEGYLSRRSVALYEALIVPLYNSGFERRVRCAIVSEVRRHRPGAVLDAGCGPGRLLASLGRALPGADLAGVDLSPFALERAGDQLAAAGVDAALHHGDATSLPFAPGSFDAVTAWHVLGHVPAAVGGAMLAGAARVLAPGGVLVSVDHAWHSIRPGPWFEAVRSRRLLGGLLVLRTWRVRG